MAEEVDTIPELSAIESIEEDRFATVNNEGGEDQPFLPKYRRLE